MDFYLPAFYQRKPSYDDLADFVYSVLSVGGTSSPQVIRAGVQDIQLHPVKKLLFIKFTEQQLRDEVAVRLQAGLVWPAFDTTVNGWSMDKPVERVRVLGRALRLTRGLSGRFWGSVVDTGLPERIHFQESARLHQWNLDCEVAVKGWHVSSSIPDHEGCGRSLAVSHSRVQCLLEVWQCGAHWGQVQAGC